MSPLSPEHIIRGDLEPEILGIRNEHRLNGAVHSTANGQKKKKPPERLRMITVDPRRLGRILPESTSYTVDFDDEPGAASTNGHVDTLSNGYAGGLKAVLQPGTKPAVRNAEVDLDLDIEAALAGDGPKKGERVVTRAWKRGGQYAIRDADPAVVIPAHQTAKYKAQAVRADRHVRMKQQAGGLGERLANADVPGTESEDNLTRRYADWIAEAADAPTETEASWAAHLKRTPESEAFWRWHDQEEIGHQWKLEAQAADAAAAADAHTDGLHQVQEELLGADPGNEEVHIRNSSHEVRFKAFKRLTRSSADHEFHNRKREVRRSGGTKERNVAEVAGNYVVTDEQRVQDSIDEAMGRVETAANDAQTRDWQQYMVTPLTDTEVDAVELAERERRYGYSV